MKKKTIVIVGGGAAGMMAAFFASERSDLHEGEGQHVILLEKNKYLGAKVIISGGGRCNVTTGVEDIKEVLKNYPRGAEFIKKAVYDFGPLKVSEWFESRGVRLKCEEDMRVFPVSNNGKDIVGALEKALRENGVEIRLGFNVSKVSAVNSGFEIEEKNGEKIVADKLILTTGGNAYRHTGSTGDGYSFAQALGHKITGLAPSLAALKMKGVNFEKLAGISFKKVGLKFVGVSGFNCDRIGPIVFTHWGVSGPAVFALSGKMAYEKFSNEQPATLSLDFFPELAAGDLEKRILELLEKNKSKLLKNVLGFLIPQKIVDLMIESGVLPAANYERLNASEVGKNLRKDIVGILKNWKFELVGRSAGDEFVTAGGVSTEEVNEKTMESKIRPGLFFAGEILDIDGFTGGFNLQASWATGALAGREC